MIRPRPPLLPLLLATLAAGGCGAKTGLLVPDGGVAADAAVDVDAGACPGIPVPLERRNVETVFLIDRSGSMELTWDGRPGGVGLPSRWDIVAGSLAVVLPPYDNQLLVGGKVFPFGLGCDVGGGLDVPPRRDNVPALLALFDRFVPEGGTPAAVALENVLADLGTVRDDPAVVVLAMDGGPNCNPMPGTPPDRCVCTGLPGSCVANASQCLDDLRMLDVLRTASDVRGVPVVVIGIDDPSRPELSDFLDEMAVAGGFPRPPGAERRFYNAREPEDLAIAFERIAEQISRCVLAVPRPPPAGATVSVTVDGEPLPRDPDRLDGWDWTDEARGAMGFFGPTCDALRAREVDIRAEVVCVDDGG